MDLLTLGLINKMKNFSGGSESGSGGAKYIMVEYEQNGSSRTYPNKSPIGAKEIYDSLESGTPVFLILFLTGTDVPGEISYSECYYMPAKAYKTNGEIHYLVMFTINGALMYLDEDGTIYPD